MRKAQWGLARLLILNARALSHPKGSTVASGQHSHSGPRRPCAPHSCVQANALNGRRATLRPGLYQGLHPSTGDGCVCSASD